MESNRTHKKPSQIVTDWLNESDSYSLKHMAKFHRKELERLINLAQKNVRKDVIRREAQLHDARKRLEDAKFVRNSAKSMIMMKKNVISIIRAEERRLKHAQENDRWRKIKDRLDDVSTFNILKRIKAEIRKL